MDYLYPRSRTASRRPAGDRSPLGRYGAAGARLDWTPDADRTRQVRAARSRCASGASAGGRARCAARTTEDFSRLCARGRKVVPLVRRGPTAAGARRRCDRRGEAARTTILMSRRSRARSKPSRRVRYAGVPVIDVDAVVEAASAGVSRRRAGLRQSPGQPVIRSGIRMSRRCWPPAYPCSPR